MHVPTTIPTLSIRLRLWDQLLTRGKLFFGVASDDAHTYRPAELEDPLSTRPGGGWVMVRADTLSQQSIMAAMDAVSACGDANGMCDHHSRSNPDVLLCIERVSRCCDCRQCNDKSERRHHGGESL